MYLVFFFFFFLKREYYIDVFFFFQAEDGIRDGTVTGVQTCALPISRRYRPAPPISRAAPTSRCAGRWKRSAPGIGRVTGRSCGGSRTCCGSCRPPWRRGNLSDSRSAPSIRYERRQIV